MVGGQANGTVQNVLATGKVEVENAETESPLVYACGIAGLAMGGALKNSVALMPSIISIQAKGSGGFGTCRIVSTSSKGSDLPAGVSNNYSRYDMTYTHMVASADITDKNGYNVTEHRHSTTNISTVGDTTVYGYPGPNPDDPGGEDYGYADKDWWESPSTSYGPGWVFYDAADPTTADAVWVWDAVEKQPALRR